MIEGRFNGDPTAPRSARAAACEDEPTVVEGIGQDAVRCAACGAVAAPFAFANGYTIAFDEDRVVG